VTTTDTTDAADPADAGRRPTAKRDRVRQHLLDVIENAGPGTSLASERDLAEELGVSRPTVRAAIDELIGTGQLVRQWGRGTFTSPEKVTQELGDGPSAAFAVPPAEGAWTSRVVEFRTAPAGLRAARLLIGPTEPVLRVVRLRMVDDAPMSIERLELPATIVPGLTSADMEDGNFYRLLRERFGVVVCDAVQTLEPAVANPDQADLLDIPVYAPILQVERTTRDTTGRTVEFAHAVYRGDRYRITSHLRFDTSSG
jgi:GntR family transcriptional regulator